MTPSIARIAGGPRDLTAERACEQAFERLAQRLSRADGRRRRVPRQWSDPSSALGHLLGGHAADCERAVPAPGLARGVLDRIEGHFLNKDKQPRQRFDGYSAKDCETAEAWRVHRTDVLTVGRDVARRAEGVQARSERRALAGGPPRVPDRAQGIPRRRSIRMASWIFPRRWRRPCCCWRRWRSSRAAAIAWKGVTTTSSSTSSRIRAARSGRWSRCSSDRGAKAAAWPTALRSCRRSSSSAIASSRFTAFVTRMSP